MREAADLLAAGRSLRQVAAAVDVGHGTVRNYRQRGLLAEPAAPCFRPVEALLHGGLLTALPALLEVGLLRFADSLPALSAPPRSCCWGPVCCWPT